ncbi:MAG TPA: anti-sigma factor [Anaerolineales bacterium]|nr:anti-sigma factor [Anaerolineales bacterium]
MTPRSAHVEDELAAYSLDALDAVEREWVEAHLAGCSRCRASLAEYQQVADGLLFVPPPQPPPANLRERIRKSLPSNAPRTVEARRSPWVAVHSAMTGALAMAVVVLSVTAWQIKDALLRQEKELARLEAGIAERSRVDGVALALLSYPDRQVAMISGESAYGTVVYEPRIPLVIMNAWGLPELAPGEVFQAWLIRPDGERLSGGLFLRDPGTPFTRVLLEASEPVSNFIGVGVTIEPEGGSLGPTGQQVLRADF